MFDEIPSPNLPSFNAAISGLTQCGQFQQSLQVFKHLESEGFRPNSVTLASILPACQTSQQGLHLLGVAVKAGLESDRYVATALVTMFCNCCELGLAQRVFGQIPDKTVVSYNAMVSGCLRNGSANLALDLFREMAAGSGVQISCSSLLSVLSACTELSAPIIGKEIHCYSLKSEAISDVMIGTTLVDMYSKCGLLNLAHRLFMRMDNKNVVTWNSLISGCASNGCLDKALELFQQLRLEGIGPDASTWNLMINMFSQQGNGVEAFKFFTMMWIEGTYPSLKSLTSILQVCSSFSNLHYGKEIHCHVIRSGAIDGDEFIQTALVHMYMTCGSTIKAHSIFDRMEKKSGDPALWNAMICGYGRNGENDSALQIFRNMQEQNVKPNSATFLGILSAYSHSGQVGKGWEIFQMMCEEDNVRPTTEHLSIMVDLLGRSGMLAEAWDLINEIPKPSISVYSSFLGACGCHSNAELGKLASDRISEMEPGNPAPLVILSNIYARQGRWNDVEQLRKMINDRTLNKIPGHSWIEVK